MTSRTARIILAMGLCLSLVTAAGCLTKKRIYPDARPAGSMPGQEAAQQQAEPQVFQQQTRDNPTPKKTELVEREIEDMERTVAPVSTDPMQGQASWISDDFQGSPTDSGIPYDRNKLTASHRTLLLGSSALVTNLNNGRTVEVVIINRGPSRMDRVIDLSRAAAKELDMIGTGLAPVRITLVPSSVPAVTPATPTPTPAPTPVATATPTQKASPGGSLYVQVGAFQSEKNARSVLADLLMAGYPGSRILPSGADGLHKVQAGAFRDRAAAQIALENLRETYPTGFLIKD